jgi:nicotinamidase/pyrazinamidase
VHCVQGTAGAELQPDFERDKVDVLLDKGMDRWSQGYSGFHGSGLAELLQEQDVDRVFVAGLTTEYCVKNTVLDARKLGLDVVVVEDAIRPVEVQPGDADRAVAEMKAAGAEFMTSSEVLAARTHAG